MSINFTSVTVTNGSANVTINTSIDLTAIQYGWELQVIGAPLMLSIASGGQNEITLQQPYTATSTLTNVAAKIIETKAALAAALDNVTLFGNQMIATKNTNQAIVDSLGSAAVLDATSSATDTNSNKLSKVGDFGSGALITTNYPISNIDIVSGVGGGLYRYINLNTGTFPPGFSGFGNIWVNKYDANNASQILVDLNGKSAFRHVNNDVPSGWNINFTSGNSVNPLDFGLGADNNRNAEITDCDTVKAAGFYTVSASATNRPPGTPANNTKLVVLGGSFASRATQIFSNDAVGVSSIWVRNYNAAWSDWQEIFHSGNTNFDTWKSAAVGDILCTAIAISSTTLRFFIDTDFKNNPNGISVLAGKTFSIATSVDAAFATGITTLNFNGRSTPKQLIFDVVTSGLTTDKTYQLRSEQSDSQFKATF
jgi:hypothetical protein